MYGKSKQWLPALPILAPACCRHPLMVPQLPYPLVQELEGQLVDIERDVRMLSKASVVRISST
jgi:hypothetical protein